MTSYDIAVVGGGPAGLTAALYARRAGRSVVLLERESFGGQITFSPMVDNYPALPHVSGAELANRLYEQVDSLGAELTCADVTAVRREADGFALMTDLGAYRARALILATGVKHRTLGLPGEEELVGCGVSYCAVCDGAFYAGRDVAVVGGGDTALQDALFLSRTCRSVTLLHRRAELRGEAALAAKLRACENVTILLSHTVEALHAENGALTGLTVRDRVSGQARTLAVDGVFAAVGQQPCAEAFADLAEPDEAGYLLAGEDTATRCPGVFAAGDCRRKAVRQLTTAVGDGASAALAACRYLQSLEKT